MRCTFMDRIIACMETARKELSSIQNVNIHILTGEKRAFIEISSTISSGNPILKTIQKVAENSRFF